MPKTTRKTPATKKAPAARKPRSASTPKKTPPAKKAAKHLAPAWKPGQSGNPKGRPPGSKNKLSEAFISALCEDFETHGVDVIRHVRADSPADYLKLVARLVPKDFNVTHQGDAFQSLWKLVAAGGPTAMLPKSPSHIEPTQTGSSAVN